MNNADFWKSINEVIADGFTSEGLQKLDHYAELFINGRLVYKRFSPFEQHGCAAGGTTHVVASLLAGAETASDRDAAPDGNDFKRELQRGAQQADRIERWACAVGCWTERIDDSLPKMLGDRTYATPEIYLSDTKRKVERGNRQRPLFDHCLTIVRPLFNHFNERTMGEH
jgi:hypothetical protein